MRNQHRRVVLAAFFVLALTIGAVPALATSHTSSGVLPQGTPIDVSIDDPLDGSEFLVPTGEETISVDVSGAASIGLGDPDATFIYVVDVSGSTTLDSGSACGTFLECERAFLKSLNTAVSASGSVDEIGFVVFGLDAAAADMQPVDGDQLLTQPGETHLDTVADSLYAGESVGGGVTQFSVREVGGFTNYQAGLEQAATIVDASSNTTNIVVFVSDGEATRGMAQGFRDAADALDEKGAVVHSIAIGDANCNEGGINGDLQYMADSTGGTCTVVTDPNTLPNIIPDLISSSLDSLTLSVDGNTASPISNDNIDPDLPQDGPASVSFDTTVAGLGVGSHELCVTASGTDVGGTGNSGAACATVDLLQIELAPESETALPGETRTVTATILGGDVSGRAVTFEIVSGPNAGATGTCSTNADCTTDSAGTVSWTYEPVQGQSGSDTIKASFTLNDPTGATGSAEVMVQTLGPADLLDILIEDVRNSEVAPSIKRSLGIILLLADYRLDAGQTGSTCRMLETFEFSIERFFAFWLTDQDEAGTFVEDSRFIRELLGCTSSDD